MLPQQSFRVHEKSYEANKKTVQAVQSMLYTQISSDLNRRQQRRFRYAEVARKYSIDSVDVRLVTTESKVGAKLIDLSTGGAKIVSKEAFTQNAPIGIELQIGQYVLEIFGRVRNCLQNNSFFALNIQFLGMNSAETEFLSILNH